MKTNEPSLESLDQMANATAAGLTRAAAGSAFDLFRDKQFCRLAGIEQLNRVEQNRIFNELVVAAVVLISATTKSVAATPRGRITCSN
jgi:hypothetical protein